LLRDLSLDKSRIGVIVKFFKNFLRDLKKGEMGTFYLAMDLLVIVVVAFLLLAVLVERILF